jgi:hypothetical protein
MTSQPELVCTYAHADMSTATVWVLRILTTAIWYRTPVGENGTFERFGVFALHEMHLRTFAVAQYRFVTLV